MVSRRVAARRGSLLADAIVASVLLGLALVGIIGLAGRSLSLQAHGQDLHIAAMLLDEQLGLVLLRGADDYASRYDTRGPCPSPYENFTYELRITGGSGGEPYLVRATVSWQRGGRERSESIETYVAPRPVQTVDRRPTQPVERQP